MKQNRYRYIIFAGLSVIIVISVIGRAGNYLSNKQAEEQWHQLTELAQQTKEAAVVEVETQREIVIESEVQPQMEASNSPIDFETVAEMNPDIVGWLRVPDTNIDYPILQTEDNDLYLHTDFYGNESQAGAIYLDFESQSDLLGRNNIIYGHNMKNGSMFKDIVKFKEQDYFKEHQYFEIYTPERTIKLKAVSCYYAKAEPIVRKTKFKTEESYAAFVQAMLEPCTFAEIPTEPIEALYTFVTCSYEINDGRTLLYAIAVNEEF